MDRQYEPIRRFLQRVRARLRALSALDAAARAALALSAVVAVALAVWSLASLGGRSPIALASLLGVVLVLAASALVWGLLPLRGAPTDAQLARFIEEQVPALDDRLATAVDIVRRETPSLLVGPLVEDAARRVDAIDVDEVVPGRRIRAGGFKAGAAAIALLVLAVMAREPARQSLDAASLALFPERVRLEIVPGNARVLQGAPLTIQARLVGNRAPVGARLEVGAGDLWRGTEMQAESGGGFRLAMPPAAADFQYRVVAGSITSPVYRVTVAHPPRVTRIDVDYAYPPALGLPPRTETDSGDVYAPAGTDVTLHVHTDRPIASGAALARERPVDCVVRWLAGAAHRRDEGCRGRCVQNRASGSRRPGRSGPDRILHSRDRRSAAGRARGEAGERPIRHAARGSGYRGAGRGRLRHRAHGTGVRRSRAVRARDPARRAAPRHERHRPAYPLPRGPRRSPGRFRLLLRARTRRHARYPRSNEGRSDIFFLEVRPFEQEFALAQSQSMAGGGYNGSIDDLVNAQKQVVVATWKLDRRGQNARGAQSPADIRAVGRTEADLKTRTEETASSLRESTMRDPRRRLQGRGDAAGQAMPEEDAMTAAVEAMGRAVVSLDALKTAAALPPEMQALNSLLEAQALVKKRQVSRQQSAQGGPGNNNRNYDVSALFDKELQRLQETRYETRQPSGGQSRENRDALEKIAELARRQDEMLKRQQDLARQRLDDAEMARQLEKLTREQAELRQQAEELARRMSKLESGQQNAAGSPSRVLVWKRADRATAARHFERHAQRHERSAPPRLGAGRGRRQPGPREAEVARTAAPRGERGPAEKARRSPA